MLNRIGVSGWRRLLVSRRLMCIPLVFTVAFLLSSVVAVHVSNQLAVDALVSDIAGRQRMLNQKQMKEILLNLQGAKADYAYSRKVFASSLDALTDGGPVVLTLGKEETVLLPPAPTQEIRAKLREQKRLMTEFMVAADALLTLPKADPLYPSKLNALLELGTTLHFAANDAVKLLGKNAEQRVSFLKGTELTIGLIAVLLGCLCSWWIICGVSRPLGHTVQVLQEVADGDLTQRLDIAIQDEVGQMAAALNRAVHDMGAAVRHRGQHPHACQRVLRTHDGFSAYD